MTGDRTPAVPLPVLPHADFRHSDGTFYYTPTQMHDFAREHEARVLAATPAPSGEAVRDDLVRRLLNSADFLHEHAEFGPGGKTRREGRMALEHYYGLVPTLDATLRKRLRAELVPLIAKHEDRARVYYMQARGEGPTFREVSPSDIIPGWFANMQVSAAAESAIARFFRECLP